MKRIFMLALFVFSLLAIPTIAAHADSACPFTTPYFVRTRPLNGNNFEIYIPGKQFAWMGFPATAFGEQILNIDAWTYGTEYLPFDGSWYNLMADFNTVTGENYLQNSDNGVFFGASRGTATKLGVLTFPGNVMLVIARKYRRGACQDLVATQPWTTSAPTFMDAKTWPPWFWQYETAEQYATAPQINPAPKNSGNIRVPLVSKKDIVTGQYGIWFPEDWVESFPALPMTIHAEYNVWIRELGYGSAVLGMAQAGDTLTLNATAPDGSSGYYPLYNRTYGYVTDATALDLSGNVTTISGWVTLVYYPGSSPLNLFDWQMETPPVP